MAAVRYLKANLVKIWVLVWWEGCNGTWTTEVNSSGTKLKSKNSGVLVIVNPTMNR